MSVLSEGEDLQRRLDQLIPAPTRPRRKLLIGAVFVAAATAWTVSSVGGYLWPRPTFGGSFDSGSSLEADRARGLVAAQVMMPNYSRRSVRITEVTLDGPGAELVDVGVLIEDRGNDTSDTGEQQAETIPIVGSLLDGASALPMWVEPGEIAMLVLWFRPIDCVDHRAPWGIAEATVDFGDGAVPPIAKTVRIDQDPIGSGEETTSVLVDGNMITASGPLAAACEALR